MLTVLTVGKPVIYAGARCTIIAIDEYDWCRVIDRTGCHKWWVERYDLFPDTPNNRAKHIPQGRCYA